MARQRTSFCLENQGWVLAELDEQAKPAMVMRTYRQVGIEVEDRRPGMEVLLTFLAPRRS